MESGYGYFPTHDAVDPATLARMVEQRGHAALLFAEHTHIPVGDGQPRNQAGGQLNRRYWHTYDLMVACTAAGLATTRLHVGSAIFRYRTRAGSEVDDGALAKRSAEILQPGRNRSAGHR